MKHPSIAIVGGGVIGWTIANEFCDRFGDRSFQIELYSPQPVQQTTSATAAAYWAPYWVGDYPTSWATETLAVMQKLAAKGASGVHVVKFEEWLTERGYAQLCKELQHPKPPTSYWWRNLPGIDFSLAPLRRPKIAEVPPHGELTFTHCAVFHTVVARMSDYLQFLRDRAAARCDINVNESWVDELPPLCDRCDYVFNCTGWGAKVLCRNDPETAAMRLLAGMVCRVNNDSIPTAISLHHHPFDHTPLYIVPRHGTSSDIICGGTAIEVVDTPDPRNPIAAPDPSLWQDIMDRCRHVSPLLLPTDGQSNLCGLRPVRNAVRVEQDSQFPNLIHCYGHGGAGLTLSWGSARAAVDLCGKL